MLHLCEQLSAHGVLPLREKLTGRKRGFRISLAGWWPPDLRRSMETVEAGDAEVRNHYASALADGMLAGDPLIDRNICLQCALPDLEFSHPRSQSQS